MKSSEQYLSQQDSRKNNRRDFLLGLGRIAALAGVVIAGYCIKKSRNGGLETERCSNGRFCRYCSILGTCNLPSALAARQAAERK